MKGKISILVLIIAAIASTLVKFKCGAEGTDTVNKIVAAALPQAVVHDTAYITVSKEVVKWKTSIVYKDQYWPEKEIVLQQIEDTASMAALQSLRDSLAEVDTLEQPTLWQDSVIDTWGTGHIGLLLYKGKPISWSLQVEPNPDPNMVSLDSLNQTLPSSLKSRLLTTRNWHAGLGASWNLRHDQPVINVLAGKGRWYGLLQINNKPRIESIGVNYIWTF